jgi:hypothetical protein
MGLDRFSGRRGQDRAGSASHRFAACKRRSRSRTALSAAWKHVRSYSTFSRAHSSGSSVLSSARSKLQSGACGGTISARSGRHKAGLECSAFAMACAGSPRDVRSVEVGAQPHSANRADSAAARAARRQTVSDRGIVRSGLSRAALHAGVTLRKQSRLGRRPSIGIMNARLERALKN